MSNYFLRIPDVWYRLEVNGRSTMLKMKDIACNVRINDYIVNNITEYNHYPVMNGDTWDSISQKFYGVPHYHWLLMILNMKWGGNSDLPVQESVMVDRFNESMARQTDEPGVVKNRWMEQTAPYRTGVLQFQVAADFTDGEEFFAPNPDNYDNFLTTTSGRMYNATIHRIDRWAQQPTANNVIDEFGLISSPLDIFDSDEFMRNRPWLQDASADNPLEMSEWERPEFYRYIHSHKLMTARDYILMRNSELSTIKVLDPAAIAVVNAEMVNILKDAH